MEMYALRSMLADTMYHGRLATAAARRLTSSDSASATRHVVQQPGRSLPTGLLLPVATLIRSLAS